MNGYHSNSECILDYLTLFQHLSDGGKEDGQLQAILEQILSREAETENCRLASVCLRQRFSLNLRDFLLTMAALALEMDGTLRNAFRRRYGLKLPTVEYGLELISSLCPSSCETLAELSKTNPLCGLLLTTAEQAAYPMERPLILCRTALAFLTGLSFAEVLGCTLLTDQGERWLPLYEEQLEQVREWNRRGNDTALYLCAPSESGRRTLLRRACGRVVCADLPRLAGLSFLDRDHILRETAVQAILLDAPVCILPDRDREGMRELERLCRQFQIPVAVLTEEDAFGEETCEMIRLPRQLSAAQKEAAWRAFVPQTEPEAVPFGAMTIGVVKQTAALARRFALSAERSCVVQSDVSRAMRRRGGAMEFGVRFDVSVTLEDMILPEAVLEQIELICQAAQGGIRLATWGIPRQREGVTAVFHGPSGTGKTMAASAIAHRLEMPLLRADLSAIMDKYIGETEKHLGRLFRSARENHCVLLFDEADALFGKRAAISTAHDKYANLSTSYLLQEIEQYDGVALLSTNFLNNFDDAFLRRLDYIVRFSLPDAALRKRLWQRALPPERWEGDLSLDVLAQVELSPARIFSVVRGAAVAAMAAGQERIDTGVLVKALRLELEKGGKSLPGALMELESWPCR